MGMEHLVLLLFFVIGVGVWPALRRQEQVIVRSERPFDLTPVYHLRRNSLGRRSIGARHG
jgi:hypothetical protein